MIRIPLSRGLFALIDDEDAALAEFKWSAQGGGGRIMYAARNARQPDGTRKNVRLHRLIMGAPPDMFVDHINGDGLDCRRANLRLATNQQNLANQQRSLNNTSGYKGVTWDRQGRRWRAQIRVHGRNRCLGLFDTAEKAALAYDEAAIRGFGEFARPNLSASRGLLAQI
jgi:hypothetical protein